MAEVSFICKRTVISARPVQPGKFIPLSVLDRIMEHNNLRIVFYYQLPAVRKVGELTMKLRESISEMLSSFPVVVGRLLKSPEGRWTVKCNDAGLRMVEARARVTLDEWLRNVDREKELKLVHWEEMFHKPYFWSTFYVQITEFETGGLAIGLSCTHLLSDPKCATMLIKAWADTTLGGKIISPPSFQPLPPQKQEGNTPNHRPYFQMINHYKSVFGKPYAVSDVKQTTFTLEFKHEMVKRFIEMSETALNGQEQELKLTPFEVLSALFWTSISKAKGIKGSLMDMSVSLDARQKLQLDKGFFGNCTVYNMVKGDGLNENEVSKAAAAIKEVVSQVNKDTVMDFIEFLEQENIENPPWMTDYHLICANLENADPYSAIFEGNSSPVRVSYYLNPAVGPGQVLIFPSPGSDADFGRVVMVTLEEDEAENVLNDELIQQFSPTILMRLSERAFLNENKST
ncbi:protein ECERIFERUM 26-like [Primulina eburnea]|uniref:protein ECERIFERUM 26-like n=1 Tax=Primulina eburnea TaxID=1245227 RepID=UPI003C6C07B5